MGFKNTIALIGASTRFGQLLSKSLVSKYRLLLVDADDNELNVLKTHLEIVHDNSEIELLNCSKEASWEADIIILAVTTNEQYKIASILKEVATCKTVISITNDDKSLSQLNSILPNCKVVSVLIDLNNQQISSPANMSSEATTALDTINQLIENIERY